MDDMYIKLIDEILELPGYNLKKMSQELDTSAPSLTNLHKGNTRKPHPPLASALICMHVYLRPDLWGLGDNWRIRLSIEDKPSDDEDKKD